jgi:hypothetical protein
MSHKYKFIVAIALLVVQPAFTQPTTAISDEGDGRIFLKVFGSYGFLTKGSFQVTPSSDTRIDATRTVERFETQKNGMGAGLRFGGGVGLILGRYINIGLDAEYLKGNTLTSTSSFVQYITKDVISEGTVSRMPDTTVSSGNYELSHSILSIIPNITFKAISTNDFNIYTRVGVLIGIPLEIKATEFNNSLHKTDLPAPARTPDRFNYFTEVRSESTYEYEAKFGIGYQAAIGIQRYFGNGNNVSFFFEVVSNSMNLRPSEYNQTYQNTITRDKYFNVPADEISFDQSRSVQTFEKSGTKNTVVTGTAPLQTTFYQSPEISMAVNSLNVAAGFTFRF